MGRARGSVISYSKVALICIIIGTAIGLGVGWVLVPVQTANADPADLRASYKDDYIRMIGAAFQLDGDISRATLRLAQLGLGTPSLAVNDLISRESKSGKSAKDTAALVELGRALTAKAGSLPAPIPTQQAGRVVSAAQAAAPTQVLATFRLIERTLLTCADEPVQAHLRIIVRDVSGNELPNVGIQVNSEATEDIIYTGLKPERGIGYADVAVVPGTYTAAILGARGEMATQLQIGDPTNCKNDPGTPRGWRLVLQKQ